MYSKIADGEKQILALLNEERAYQTEGAYIEGDVIRQTTGLSVDEINEAVEILDGKGYLDTQRFLGTHPFSFGMIALTAQGMMAFKSLSKEEIEQDKPSKASQLLSLINEAEKVNLEYRLQNFFPTGSPFGFTADDWEQVVVDKDSIDKLIVVLGHQWKSTYFSSESLRINLKNTFMSAIESMDKSSLPKFDLDFRILQGGYGNHVFNKIACDIIGSDIAIFETSDANSNVMIEMGIALTWGVRTLPILHSSVEKTPSDIAGLHWAKYKDDGATWIDPEHFKKLQIMITNVMARKPGKRRFNS